MQSGRRGSEEDEDEDDECLDHNWDSTEGSSQRVGDAGKMDYKGNDQRANASRSKHSVTEQRRRSKINERFEILRGMVPQVHSDQKRDKASFLLEVIDYIHLLHEKVQKHDGSYPQWNENKMKMMALKSTQGPADRSMGYFQTTTGGAPFVLDCHHPAFVSVATNLENVNQELPPSHALKAVNLDSFPASGICRAVATNAPLEPQKNLPPHAGNLAEQPQYRVHQRACSSNQSIRNDIAQLSGDGQEEFVIDGGAISISSTYSQELLGSLTKALEASGVDLSQASMSVQINLSKQPFRIPSATASAKDHEEPSSRKLVVPHLGPENSNCLGVEQAGKRQKIDQ